MRPQLKHLDGHAVAVGSKTVVRPGEQRWFKGEGMPIMDEVGWRPGRQRGWEERCWMLQGLCEPISRVRPGPGMRACPILPSPLRDPASCPGDPLLIFLPPVQVKRGDLWVTYRVIFPKMLTQAQQDIIKEVLTQTTWHDEL